MRFRFSDLCCLYGSCYIHRLFLNVHVMKLSLYCNHPFVAIGKGREKLILFKENRSEAMKLDLALIFRPSYKLYLGPTTK